MLSAEKLQKEMLTHIFGKKVLSYETIDSTNTRAKRLASDGAEEGTIVLTDDQTAGRGRFGKSWQSEPGSNLLFSMIIRPRLDNSKVGLLPFFAATGVALAVESKTGLHCECKWPNDILLNGKKCCGILIENIFHHHILDYSVIGIGLNVNQKNFSEDLADRVTSLSLECGREFERNDIFHKIMMSLELLYTDVKKGNFESTLREWKIRATMFDRQITLTQGDVEIQGRALSLAADGGLVLETTKGRQVFYAGDVTITRQD